MANGIMSLFKSAAPAQQQQPNQGAHNSPLSVQPQPGETAPTPGQQTPINPATQVVQPGNTAAAAATKDPMGQFKDLWDAPKVDPNNPVQTFDPDTMFNLDPAKLAEAAGQMNFMQGVAQEDLQAIVQGGEPAAKALANIVNKSTQAAFTQAVTAVGKLVQSGIKRTMPAVDSRVKDSVRLTQFSSSLQQENPALAHPAAQPIIAGLQQQLAVKYPTATPEELKAMAGEYLTNLATLINAPGEAKKLELQNSQAAAKETDWEKMFLGGPVN